MWLFRYKTQRPQQLKSGNQPHACPDAPHTFTHKFSVLSRPGMASSVLPSLQQRGQPTGCVLPRKEVIQPHLPVRLPCYDFTPITNPTLDACLPSLARRVSPAASGVADFRGVTGG